MTCYDCGGSPAGSLKHGTRKVDGVSLHLGHVVGGCQVEYLLKREYDNCRRVGFVEVELGPNPW